MYKNNAEKAEIHNFFWGSSLRELNIIMVKQYIKQLFLNIDF